jgi:hypothetical protein
LRDKTAEYRTHVLEFVLFFLLTLIVWGDGDLIRYLIEGKRPTAGQFLWVAGGYAVVWTAASVLCEHLGGLFRRVLSVELTQPTAAIVEEPAAEAGD